MFVVTITDNRGRVREKFGPFDETTARRKAADLWLERGYKKDGPVSVCVVPST